MQSISAEADKTALLRFYGYMQRTDRVPAGQFLYLPLMIRSDLGELVQQYASWLQNTQRCKFSTIANYLNGLVSITSYCANLEPSDAVFNLDPNPLAQIINLRGQAEKASKTQQMYDQRVGGWLTWEEVQQTRVKCLAKLAEVSGSEAARRSLSRDAAALSLAAVARATPSIRTGSRRGCAAPALDRDRQSSHPRPDAKSGNHERVRTTSVLMRVALGLSVPALRGG